MAGYKIIRHPNYEEIHVSGDLDLATVREVVGELRKAEDFLRRHALWQFALDVRPLAFRDFDDVIVLLEKVYARGASRGKRVALVAEGSFARSVAEMFAGQARTLPVALRVFDAAAPAREWIEG